MGELLMVWLTRLPKPTEIWSNAAASGGLGWLALCAAVAVAVWLGIWWLLRVLFFQPTGAAAAGLFLLALATGAAAGAAMWNVGGH